MLHYNPQSGNQLRLEEILRATRNFSIGWFGGYTTEGLQWDSRLDLQNSFGCTIVKAGWARAPLSNKSAGVLIALRKPFTSEHVHQTWTPPPSLQGSSTRGTSQRRFFRSVCLLHVPSSPDHKLHRKEEGTRGLWNVCYRTSVTPHWADEKNLVPSANTGELKVFDGKMKSDDHRYLAELSPVMTRV